MGKILLGHSFRDLLLIQRALTHRSSGKEHNERLEFLGDALLGAVIAEDLYRRFPEATEGELSQLRASLVKGETLAELAREVDLADQIKFGNGELKSGGWRRESILSDTVEAVLGAIYLDSDFATCKRCILDLYAARLAACSLKKLKKNPKTILQEYLQVRNMSLPVYTTLSCCGEAHNPCFTVSCVVEVIADPIVAKGSSKRYAEQLAAEEVLRRLEVSLV